MQSPQDPGWLCWIHCQVRDKNALCTVSGVCYYRTLTCPAECPQRKPKQNKKQKGCYVDCSSKCEAISKWRLPRCDGYGALCYDPRFVGGDGVMFYFHGAKETDFAIVSDDNLHINAHLIGTRPKGRSAISTCVQTLSWNGEIVNVPTDGDAEWSVNTAERSVEKENKVHNYQLPEDDAFAYLETQFKFFSLSKDVEGILGKTYQPGYVSPVKRGVPMPIMGGEDKYQTSSLHSAICKKCRFRRPSSVASA
ncbi:hypothetical protein HAX54_035038 [Datura stramonium]|uniref:DOMON domain-containing protein n=1 Tax=Datura stramonium TaxID=4076 RepID=A0ABS8SEU8_DATST|nr:hypothetical protein [Datura stramonium]